MIIGWYQSLLRHLFCIGFKRFLKALIFLPLWDVNCKLYQPNCWSFISASSIFKRILKSKYVFEHILIDIKRDEIFYINWKISIYVVKMWYQCMNKLIIDPSFLWLYFHSFICELILPKRFLQKFLTLFVIYIWWLRYGLFV